MWHANIIGSVVVFLLGIFTTISAWRLPYATEYSPGPGFLPLWLGIVMALCALFVMVGDLRSKERSLRFFVPETLTCLKVLILIVAVFLTLPVFGFSVGLALITAAGMRLMGKHSWTSCALTVIVTAVCIHYLFGSWLSIPLPQGLIGW
jgi:putative tricarboxylic transport membrane protein